MYHGRPSTTRTNAYYVISFIILPVLAYILGQSMAESHRAEPIFTPTGEFDPLPTSLSNTMADIPSLAVAVYALTSYVILVCLLFLTCFGRCPNLRALPSIPVPDDADTDIRNEIMIRNLWTSVTQAPGNLFSSRELRRPMNDPDGVPEEETIFGRFKNFMGGLL